MNRKQCSTLFLLLLLPTLSFADALSFQPPTTDVSVQFLSNIFGVVDGVLSGTGSQIVGQMFSVFNSALVALAGIIVLYVVLVSTMNTAQEGEMLGRKWSSTWIPLRLVFGIGLLIPKSTGYCIMQVLVMWIVVQGVGAADKVWNAALSYLNRGGVIIQAQLGGSTSLQAGGSTVAKGAAAILQGQVCMIGLQNQLTRLKKIYEDSGSCPKPTENVVSDISILCNNPVPDMAGAVNALDAGIDSNTQLYTLPLPNDQAIGNSPYSKFVPTGTCGTIKWAQVAGVSAMQSSQGLTQDEANTVTQSRSIAVQQLYIGLLPVAQSMVNNDPALNDNVSAKPSDQAVSGFAVQQFGVPINAGTGSPCSTYDTSCTAWGPIPTGMGSQSVLFTGTEFQNAIAAYNGIIAPTLNLQSQQLFSEQAATAKKFISAAETQGWMMAGSYFYNLAALNTMGMGNPLTGDQQTDTQSKLDQSVSVNTSNLQCSSDPSSICSLFGTTNEGMLSAIATLIQGNSNNAITSLPNGYPPAQQSTYNSTQYPSNPGHMLSTTVMGYLINASMIVLPNQPGFAPPAFKFHVPLLITSPVRPLQKQTFHGGMWDIPGVVATFFWNFIVINLFNMFLNLVQQIINTLVMTFLSLPLNMFGRAFNDALLILQTPNINPVIALAKMGAYYINYSMDLWILLIEFSIMSIMIPIFGIVVLPLIMMSLPLVMSWTGVMVSVGFSTAYYVPFLPYMIFTFGSIAWIIGVIEAMVAGPIVALGVTHPEGHEVLGKAEQAIMLILNVFLRPAMMIIGYMTAIALTYVGVWVLNTGFDNAVYFITSDQSLQTSNKGTGAAIGAGIGQATADALTMGAYSAGDAAAATAGATNPASANTINTNTWEAVYQSSSAGYTGWAAIYAQFFGVLVYTTMYLTIVQKAFTLITHLPDKVLRWIGGQQESLGGEAEKWTQEGQKQIDSGSQATGKAGGQIQKKLYGKGMGYVDGASMLGSSSSAGGGSGGGGLGGEQ